MEITGAFRVRGDAGGYPRSDYSTVSGAFTKTTNTTSAKALEDTGGNTTYEKVTAYNFTASNKWSGATSAGSSHTHTFTGGTASFGSGNYLRPNSTAILYCIKY